MNFNRLFLLSIILTCASSNICAMNCKVTREKPRLCVRPSLKYKYCLTITSCPDDGDQYLRVETDLKKTITIYLNDFLERGSQFSGEGRARDLRASTSFTNMPPETVRQKIKFLLAQFPADPA